MKYEIWATFENGKTAKVETHKTKKAAFSAVDAMNAHNQHDLSVGYGFPYGVPTYSIKSVQ